MDEIAVEYFDFKERCYPPGRMPCDDCRGDGWNWIETEGGEVNQVDCPTCGGEGHVPDVPDEEYAELLGLTGAHS